MTVHLSLVLGVDANRLFLTNKPEQWTGQVKQGLAQEEVDKKRNRHM